MRPDTYDTILDTAIELSKYGGWFCLSLFIFGIISLVMYLILIEGFDLSIPTMFFTAFAFIIPLVTTMFIFMIQKTKKRFGVTYWRDFWMAFGHPYCIEGGYNKVDKINEWLDENIPRLYRITGGGPDIIIVFKHKEDAMACKLRWS